MTPENRRMQKPHLVWVYPEPAQERLDAATWLVTTQELRNSGWDVTLVSRSRTDNGQQTFRDTDIYFIGQPDVYLFSTVLFHIKVIIFLLKAWSSIDIIMFHQMSAPWIFPLKLLRLLSGKRKPLLLMDTRTVPMDMSTLKWWLRGSFELLMNRIANIWVDGQTAITEPMAKAVKIPPEKLFGVWPSGVQVKRFAMAQEKREWPQPDEAIKIIYIGSMHNRRNLMALCHAVEKANNAGLKFEMVLVGDGWERPDLENYAAQTAGRIQVLPPVPHTEIPQLLGQAHIGALPFPDEEQFRVSSPIKLFEYMAAGLPILATHIECHTSVLGNEEFVFWAYGSLMEDLCMALEAIWHARVELGMLGAESARSADQWSWSTSAQKLNAALTALLVKNGIGVLPAVLATRQTDLVSKEA